MKIVALLPMKANSVRVKQKNFREFCGKPLFRWVLDTLLGIEEIDTIVINTDACGILREHGLLESDRVVLRERKEEIRGDHVSMNLVLADDVAHVPADIYLMTHTTNPLLSADTVRAALQAFTAAMEKGEADSLFTVNRIQTRFYRADGTPVNHDPGNLIPTQELEPWFEENSNLYLFARESFARTGARIGTAPMMFETSPLETVDIDTPADWARAEAVARILPSGGSRG